VSQGAQIIKDSPTAAPGRPRPQSGRGGSVRREILDRTLILNATHPRQVLTEYKNHFNAHLPPRVVDRNPIFSPERASPHDPYQVQLMRSTVRLQCAYREC
jgi:hypothetical protein